MIKGGKTVTLLIKNDKLIDYKINDYLEDFGDCPQNPQFKY